MELHHHDLATEFPEYKQAIHELKASNAHFKRLFEEYEAADREIVRIEQQIETTSDLYLEQIKKQRLKLKDELIGMLKAQAA